MVLIERRAVQNSKRRDSIYACSTKCGRTTDSASNLEGTNTFVVSVDLE